MRHFGRQLAKNRYRTLRATLSHSSARAAPVVSGRLHPAAELLEPDLVLLDMGLPTLNGIEAARQIRKLAPESRIIFVSQESAWEVVQEALNLGA